MKVFVARLRKLPPSHHSPRQHLKVSNFLFTPLKSREAEQVTTAARAV